MHESEFCFIVGLVVIATIVVMFVWMVKRSGTKNLESAWAGEVVDKSVVKNYGEGVGEVTISGYRLKVQLDDGKKRTASVQKAFYDSVGKGDKLVKTAGEEYPKKA